MTLRSLNAPSFRKEPDSINQSELSIGQNLTLQFQTFSYLNRDCFKNISGVKMNRLKTSKQETNPDHLFPDVLLGHRKTKLFHFSL